jgi:tetratricopeptide (TPR) repeat protein
LRLLEVEQHTLAREKLEEASKTDPEDGTADCFLGLGYAVLRRDAANANAHFAKCVQRDRGHPSSLNNLVLAEIRLGDYDGAVLHWNVALSTAPAAFEIVHNIGRLLDLEGKGIVKLPSSVRQKAADL